MEFSIKLERHATASRHRNFGSRPAQFHGGGRMQVERDFESEERAFLPSVYSALADNQDTSALRDEYIRMRKDFYAKLGDECDDRMLDSDWVDFKEYTQSILRNDRARETRENRAQIKDKEDSLAYASAMGAG